MMSKNTIIIDDVTASQVAEELSREIANAIEESIQLADQGRAGEAQAVINKLCSDIRYKPMVGVIPNGNVKLTEHPVIQHYANEIANASRFGEANFSIPLNGRGPWTPAMKGKLDINDMIREVHGLRIIIENAKGSLRCGYTKDGKRWETRMPADYGYVSAVDLAANSGNSESVRRSWLKRKLIGVINGDHDVVSKDVSNYPVADPEHGDHRDDLRFTSHSRRWKFNIEGDGKVIWTHTPSKGDVENVESHIERKFGSRPTGHRKIGWPNLPEYANSFVPAKPGSDGDGVDCWLGEVPSEQVHIIDQRDLDTKKFDEHKCFVDFASRQAAIDTYVKAYNDGRGQERIMGVRTLNIPQFKEWLQTAKTKKRASRKNFVNATTVGSEDQNWQKDHHDAVRNEIEAVYREALDDALTEGGEELLAAQKDGHGEAALAALLLLIGMRLKAAAQRSYRGSLMGLGSVLKGPAAARAASGYSVLRAAKLKNAVTKLGSTISASVQRGVAGGESPQAILRRLKEAVQPEVDLIAETETQVTYGTVQNLALALSGFTKKIWVTMADERVRHSHALCEAQGAIPLDHKFTNGLRFPGDPEGPASEVINCRCYLLGVK